MAILFVSASAQTIAMGSGSSALQAVYGSTLMCWYYPTTLVAQASLVGLSNGTATTQSRSKIGALSSGAIRTGGRCADSNSYQSYDGTAGVVTASSWNHICGVFDYSNQLMIQYCNGAYVSTSATITGWSAAPTSDTASIAFNIGSQHNGGSEYSNGAIDDARVYNRVLSSSEIQTIYSSRGCDDIIYGLKHRYLTREAHPSVVVTSIKDMAELQKNSSTVTNSPTYAEGILSDLAIPAAR